MMGMVATQVSNQNKNNNTQRRKIVTRSRGE